MAMAENTAPETKKKFLSEPDKITGFLIMAASAFFFFFTVTGKWSSGAGIGARLFPQISIGIMFFSGAAVFFQKPADGKSSKLKSISPGHIFLFLGVAFLYVLAVITIGLAVGTFFYFLTLFFYFQRWDSPVKNVLFPAFIVTVFVWSLFTYFAQIVLPQVLLF